jgi:hypothetical protein
MVAARVCLRRKLKRRRASSVMRGLRWRRLLSNCCHKSRPQFALSLVIVAMPFSSTWRIESW